MLPTLLTMFVSGFWHGAGYLFILWGVLHGLYLTVNHGWRLLVARRVRDRARYDRVMKPVGFLITFFAVVIGMVIFRAPTMGTAAGVFWGMLGLNGFLLPSSLYDRVGPLAHVFGRASENAIAFESFKTLAVWIPLLLVIALGLPNTLEILSRYEPALGVKPIAGAGTATLGARIRTAFARVAWNPTLAWAIGLSVLAAIGVYQLGGNSEFLYWQF